MSRPLLLLATFTLLAACGARTRIPVALPKPSSTCKSCAEPNHHATKAADMPPMATASGTPSTNGRWHDSFGPDGPVIVDRVASDGRWVSYCSPAAGNAAPLTLAWSDAKTESITAILGQSGDGSAVAFADGNSWQLVVVDSKQRFDLTRMGIDRRLAVNERDARSIAFHPTRSLVALLLRHSDAPSVTVLDYVSGSETSIRPLSHEVSRLAWDPSGEFLLLDEIPEDTNKNRKLDWPVPLATTPRSACGELTPRFIAAAPRGDRVVTTVVPRSGGTAVPANGAVFHDGQYWLGTTEERGIARFEPSGKRQLTPKDCDARPIAVHAGTKQLLVGCSQKGRMTLGLVTTQGFRPLGIEMPSTDPPERPSLRQRFLPIYSGTSSTLVDFERLRAEALNDRDQLLAQHGTHIVLRRGATLVRRNSSDSSEVVMASDIAPGARVILGQGVAWVDPYVVSAEPSSSPYRVSHTVAAVSENGCVLSYAAPAASPAYPSGPLRWICATPSAVDKALSKADTVEKRASGSIAKACSTQASTSAGSSARNSVSRGRGAVVAAR